MGYVNPGPFADLGFVVPKTEAAGPAMYGLMYREHGERGATERRFLRGPLQGTLRMAGTVHADKDSRHLTSPLLQLRWYLIKLPRYLYYQMLGTQGPRQQGYRGR